VVAQVKADNILLADPNDRVAAFVGHQLRGVASPMVAGADTLVFLPVYSNRLTNETVRFEVWDDSDCKLYANTVERVAYNADGIAGSTVSPIVLNATEVLPDTVGAFPVVQGWNWFSTNVSSVDMDVNVVLASLAPTAGDIIRSENYAAVFDPEMGWVGTLDTLTNCAGYRIRLSDAGTVLQAGSPVDPALTPIPVKTGWNWMAYTPYVAVDMPTALADLVTRDLLTNGDIVKGHSAFSEYRTTGWLGGLGELQPGQAYHLYLSDASAATDFYYPSVSTPAGSVPGQCGPGMAAFKVADISRSSGGTEAAGWSIEPQLYQHSMVVIAVLQIGDAEWRNDQIVLGAFDGERCRGLTRPIYLAAIDRYVAFLTVHSNALQDENLTLRALDPEARLDYEVLETVSFRADAVEGGVREPLVLRTGSAKSSVPDVPSTYALMQNHPNPFNPTTAIDYDIPGAGGNVSLRIYDVKGRLVRTLVDGFKTPGRKTVTWDGRNNGGQSVATGVYFYRMAAPGFEQTRKMVLMK
jgi:hypothetical protein